jgi:hypothetical protein
MGLAAAQLGLAVPKVAWLAIRKVAWPAILKVAWPAIAFAPRIATLQGTKKVAPVQQPGLRQAPTLQSQLD